MEGKGGSGEVVLKPRRWVLPAMLSTCPGLQRCILRGCYCICIEDGIVRVALVVYLLTQLKLLSPSFPPVCPSP